jgi:hypothetical protein
MEKPKRALRTLVLVPLSLAMCRDPTVLTDVTEYAGAGGQGDIAPAGAAGEAGSEAGGGAGGHAGSGGASEPAGGGGAGPEEAGGNSGASQEHTGGAGDRTGPEGGAAGSPSDLGQGGEPLGGPEPIPTPYCTTTNGPVSITLHPTAIAVARTVRGAADNISDQLYGADPFLNIVGVRWLEPDWTPWLCFDLVVEPVRLAASMLPNVDSEVYAVTGEGRLLVRRSFPGPIYWSQWLEQTLPRADSKATDVAAVGGSNAHVYVADRGRVYFRYRLDASAGLSGWYATDRNGALLVSAELTSAGSQQVVTLSADGVIATAWQADSTLGTPFGSWHDLDTPGIVPVDLEVSKLESGSLVLFVLDAKGGIWQGALDGGSLSELTSMGPISGANRIVAVTARSLPDYRPSVYALDTAGQAYRWGGDVGVWSVLP